MFLGKPKAAKPPAEVIPPAANDLEKDKVEDEEDSKNEEDPVAEKTQADEEGGTSGSEELAILGISSAEQEEIEGMFKKVC